MPAFGPASEAQLATMHPDLVKVLRLAIQRMDFTVLEGFRGRTAQNAAYARGNSRLKWPMGNHNQWPSLAADIAPYPVDWTESARPLERFVYLQGIVWSCSRELGIAIRQGIDWNRNQDMRDEAGLHDYPHVEIHHPRPLTIAEAGTFMTMPV